MAAAIETQRLITFHHEISIHGSTARLKTRLMRTTEMPKRVADQIPAAHVCFVGVPNALLARLLPIADATDKGLNELAGLLIRHGLRRVFHCPGGYR